jgi:hypothetical protein
LGCLDPATPARRPEASFAHTWSEFHIASCCAKTFPNAFQKSTISLTMLRFVSSLWRSPWPLLRASLFVAALGGLGWGLYAWLPPEPRWTLRGPYRAHGFASDGSIVITEGLDDGSIQCWDACTGREVRRVFAGAGRLQSTAFSDDRRCVAAWTASSEGQQLWWADLSTGEENHATIPVDAERWCVELSPRGGLILLEERSDDWPKPTGRPKLRKLLFDAPSLRPLSNNTTLESADTQWANDIDALLVYDVHADEGNSSLRRITADGETIATLDGAGYWNTITADGRTLITTELQWDDEVDPALLLWDLGLLGKTRGLGQPRRIPRWMSSSTTFMLLLIAGLC